MAERKMSDKTKEIDNSSHTAFTHWLLGLIHLHNSFEFIKSRKGNQLHYSTYPVCCHHECYQMSI